MNTHEPVRIAIRDEVKAHCEAERQWPRHLRIAHAQTMLAKEPHRAAFWTAVLEKNGVD